MEENIRIIEDSRRVKQTIMEENIRIIEDSRRVITKIMEESRRIMEDSRRKMEDSSRIIAKNNGGKYKNNRG